MSPLATRLGAQVSLRLPDEQNTQRNTYEHLCTFL
uniref:Uncharacterized protein n=1 Tax=Anguilla anguilla TaxID=7936 RepID=A0A0E9VP30_ANGAN